MADLGGLIRVRKHAVEQKQKFLAELYRQAEELQGQKDNLLTTLAEEQKKTEELGIDMLPYFGPYSKAVQERVEDIDDAMVKLNKRIEFARQDMSTAFSELKKVEITQERREAEDEKEQKKKEDGDLDEMALEIFRRQQDNS